MTDQTAAVEVWARMLCAADVHVNDGDHTAWQQLPRLMQNDYRKAARWLLPRLTVAQPAAFPSAPADADLREVRKIANRLANHAKGFGDVLDESDRGPWGRLVCADIDELRAVLAVLPAPADRATVLREAADAVWAMDYDEHANDYGFDSIKDAWDGGTMDASKHLRRMADEAQQADAAGEQQ